MAGGALEAAGREWIGPLERTMDDLLREFLTETSESLDVADTELVKFEREPNNKEILNNIFRLVHTIKGTCGFIGLTRLASLAHAAETLMDKFREGMPVTQDAVSLVLITIDRVKLILSELEASEGVEPAGSDADLIDELLAMATNPPPAEEPEEEPQDLKAEPESPPANVVQMGTIVHQTLERELLPGEVPLDELERLFRQTEVEITPKAKAARSSPAKGGAKEKPAAKDKAGPKEVVSKEAAPKETPPKEATSKDAKDKAAKEKPVAAKAGKDPLSLKRADEEGGGGGGGGGTPIAAQSIRVSVGTLEHLMTMVSELVLTRNQLLEIARRNEDHDYKVSLQRLSNVTGELQDAIMRTRMQPIGNAWQKLPRIVRDLAQELGKQVELVMTGEETELDGRVSEVVEI